jgi:hypothetical protein
VAENPKAYDQAFKSLSDVDPRGLLDIFGVLPHGMDAEVEPLPREISSRPLVIDTGYFVRPARGKAFIAIFEALTSWKKEIGARLASYGAGVGDKYRMPIRIYPLPMAPHACPARLPQFGRADWGHVQVVARLLWIKPWEIDGRVVLERNSPRLDPWAVLFRLSDVQKDEVIARIKDHPREAGLFRILGGMRYRKNVRAWNELVGRLNQMISREMMRESLAVQEWLQEGRQEGMLHEARGALLDFIEAKFPSLHMETEIRSISDLSLLHHLRRVVMKAPNAASARSLILDHKPLDRPQTQNDNR